MATRVCNKCNETKDELQFSWRIKAKQIRQNICKACAIIASIEYRSSRPELIKEKAKVKYQENKEKYLAEKREYYLKNRDTIIAKRRKDYKEGMVTGNTQKIARKSALKRNFGLTLAEIERMKELQGNVCAICKREKKLVVDHCHNSGKVRGLLCSLCNTHLGYIEESKETLLRAISYLETNGVL